MNCKKCGGMIAEPNKTYGYVGAFCTCPRVKSFAEELAEHSFLDLWNGYTTMKSRVEDLEQELAETKEKLMSLTKRYTALTRRMDED